MPKSKVAKSPAWALALLVLLASSCSSEPAAIAEEGLLELPSDRPLTAGFLVVNGVFNTELTAPFDVLDHVRHQVAPRPGIDTFTVSPDGGPITTAEGLVIQPDFGFDDAPPIDILVVPSAEGSRDRDLEDPQLVGWVRDRGREARFVVSLCWGAFVLAEAGLLEDRSCTTFPSDYADFAQRFPGSNLKVNVSFVHDGKVLTSQGGARSFDVALYLVDLLYGAEAAQGVGSGLLISWPPEPGAEEIYISDPALVRRSRR